MSGAVAQLLQHVLRKAHGDRGAQLRATSHARALRLLVDGVGVEGVLLLGRQV
jgi:hypothetical protein